MKTIFTFLFLATALLGFSQTSVLPFDFESAPETSDFINFDGGTGTVVANPQMDANNGSSNVAQIVREGGEIWGGSKIDLMSTIDFSENNGFSMWVLSPAANVLVKLKLEGGGETERDTYTTVANEWELITWDFTGEPSNTFSSVVFMFDFGNVGDGSTNSTFHFDNVMQIDLTGGLDQIDLPVTFEEDNINYQVTDFGDNISTLVADPENASNTVMMTIKPVVSPTWAGTTVSTPSGLANPIPITATETTMNVKVYSPDAGIPIRLKIEDHTDPTKSVETETLTTVANQWETIEFDFNNEAEGTAALNLDFTFDMASIFFNFGTDGATAGEKTYYWDDLFFGDAEVSVVAENNVQLHAYPNPVIDFLKISAEENITSVTVTDMQGRVILNQGFSNTNINLDLSKESRGIYVVEIETLSSRQNFQIIKAQ